MRQAVVVDGVRTPIGKSGWKGMEKKGMFADVSAHDLLRSAVECLVARVKEKSSKFDPAEIEDMAVGCLSQIGEQAGNIGRIGTLISDLPDEVAGWSLDRYCNAGLQAINAQAQAIIAGCGDITIAAGVEQMSHYPMGSSIEAAPKAGYPFTPSPKFAERGGFVIMGVAAEMVAEKYDLSREDMDQFGLWSHQKAVKAMRETDWYKNRIAPVEVTDDDGKKRVIETDQTPRAQALDDPDSIWEKMKKLEPRFKKGGRVTAGSSSQIVDGAAAVMLMSDEKAKELGLEPLATIKSMAVAGSDPRIMLLGPIPAMKKALARAGIEMSDVDVFEPNEAFAAPCLAFAKEFDFPLDDPRINPTGGAIALGHPIGASGVIYFIEMVYEMVHRDLKYGLQTLCGGGGVGIATVVER